MYEIKECRMSYICMMPGFYVRETVWVQQFGNRCSDEL